MAGGKLLEVPLLLVVLLILSALSGKFITFYNETAIGRS